MELNTVGPAQGGASKNLLRVIAFGLIGAVSLALVGAIEGWAAIIAFRSIEQSLFPTYGAFVMTAESSRLPAVLAVGGLMCGGIGMALFGSGRRARGNASSALSAVMVNISIGSIIGILAGGMGGLALGRLQSQPPILLFVTFFSAVILCFVAGVIVALIVSALRKPATV